MLNGLKNGPMQHPLPLEIDGQLQRLAQVQALALRPADAVLQRERIDVRNLEPCRHAQPQIVVVAPGELLTIAADGLECGAADHRSRLRNRAVPRDDSDDLGVSHRIASRAELVAVLVDHERVPAHQRVVRMRLQEVDLPLEAVGQADVVTVEHREVGARRISFGEGAIACLHDAEVARVAEQTDARIGAQILFADRDGRVGRAVIDEHQLEVSIGLCEHALDGRPQIWRRVVDREGPPRQGGRPPRYRVSICLLGGLPICGAERRLSWNASVACANGRISRSATTGR